MQTPQAAPAAPKAPSAPATSQAAAPTAPPPAFTMEYLRARGKALSSQMNSVSGRREGVLDEMRKAPASAQPGIKLRLDVLDARLVQLEKDIQTNSQLVAQAGDDAAPTTNSSSSHPPRGFPNVDGTPIAIVFTLFVLCPIAISAARLMWKRGSRSVAPATTRESDLRLERVEQAVDAIAVEVERISEGQRFVTQLLSKGTQAPALGVGSAEPISVPLNETVMAGSVRSISK